MAIDSHMHINSKLIDNPSEYILKVMEDDSIESVINVGLDIITSKEIINYSKEYSKFYSSVGIHPLYLNNQDVKDLPSLITNKVVAIGEIGLDSSSNNYLEQKEFLIRQIHVANEIGLPVIIHSSGTNKEVIEIFENYVKPKHDCVFHCFQPDFDSLRYLIDNGYYISFAGRVTYKNAVKSHEIARLVPNDLFLVETDSPYITPEPLRESGIINESSNIKYIIQKLSEIKELSYNEIEKTTSENTKRLFKKIRH